MALTPPHPLPLENTRFLQIRGQQCAQQCESEHRHTVGGRKFLYECPRSGVQPRGMGSSTAGSGILESACVCEPMCLLRSSPRRGQHPELAPSSHQTPSSRREAWSPPDSVFTPTYRQHYVQVGAHWLGRETNMCANNRTRQAQGLSWANDLPRPQCLYPQGHSSRPQDNSGDRITAPTSFR